MIKPHILFDNNNLSIKIKNFIKKKLGNYAISKSDLIVVIGIIPSLIIYVAFFMYIFDYITGYHWSIDWLIYILAGFLWLYPATKVIKWLADNEAH
mgnify:CR=1 FL=1